MLRSLSKLTNYILQAEDGEIGRCTDFLFEDDTWIVRYMVADTGKWLPGRKVLLSPIDIHKPDWPAHIIPISLSKEQIRTAPGIEKDEPISRRKEVAFHRHYGWSPYWGGVHGWGAAPYPGPTLSPEELAEALEATPDGDPHLRSTNEVVGYDIQSLDGEIGHVEDLVVDDETWTIRYVVVDTRDWLPGKKVIVSPEWVESMNWAAREVVVGHTRDQIENSPEYDPSAPINLEYEAKLFDYYGRPKYWV